MLICEATLDDSWLDVDLFSSVTSPNRLKEEFSLFVKEWQKIEKILPTFKAAVADMQTLLLDLRRWLEQVELGIRSEPSGDRDTIEKAVIDELQDRSFPPSAPGSPASMKSAIKSMMNFVPFIALLLAGSPSPRALFPFCLPHLSQASRLRW